MSIGKKILKAIYVVIIIIELILLVIFAINHSLPEYMKDYEVFFKNLFISVSVIFVIAIVCYIIEHKMYNKNEKILDENLIEPKFDIDFKDKDILYLSTILNQKLPEKLITDELVSKLGDVAQLSNVKITLLKIQPSKMQDNLAIQNIDVALQGDYFSLLSFLRSVSLFQFVTTIQQGTMFVENDSIKCNLTLQIYADNYN